MAPDTAPMIISLAPGIEFSTRLVGDRTSYVAHHADQGKYYRFGAEEHFAASLIDGHRTVAEIHARLETSGVQWTPEELTAFVGKLIQHKIVIVQTLPAESNSQPPANPTRNNASQPPPLTFTARITALLSFVISQRFPLVNGHRVASLFDSTFGKLFTTAGSIVWTLFLIATLAIVFGNRNEFENEARKLFDPGIWPLLIAIWLVTKLFHEIGHAVAAYRHGVRIGRMGIMFFLFAPLAYVDVTDAWKLRSRWSRVQIALAGVYVELALAFIAACCWWIFPDGLLRHLSAQVFFIAGPTTLLVNANPLLRLDGYYVISDLLEIPNLRMHGRQQLGGHVEKWLVGIEAPKPLLTGWRCPAATGHAMASVVFQFFWMGGLIIAASMWARGLGIILGISAFLLWCVVPLSRWVFKVWTMDPPQRFWLNTKRRRLISLTCVLLTVVQYFSTTASPLDRRVPVVVRFHDEQISRAIVDAFVDAVHVTHGQRVEKGQLLLELRQPELLLQRQSLKDDLSLSLQRSTQHRRNGNIALADSKHAESESLSRQLKEVDEQIKGLRIMASRDGRISTPNLQRLIGSFVRRGDELVRVSDPNEKEVLAAVSARDIDTYQLAVELGRLASVRLRGGTMIQAKPSPLQPRAKIELPHPAMSAVVGGPLAVQPSDDPQRPFRLVEPQLESISQLDPITSANVSAGQVGVMRISDDRPLISRIYDHLRLDVR